ncbi:MocR-like pyridoxine biosynthesis transcription factor PdxR [Bdellovibrio svalbardensis]|uniref:PLP-dependent aminotransferase family protein n=1 Tax=Bdellovibrio svalbardensis TaxID=2972972 RepID=A0ABT6DPH8_9BACT|nr:PLP-dependent aminotransferase family protein [Bdellovibrio svalbardensis]MDG0817741.1 PLP-dependent aminotransferase family protein [Bdellovibrio svalbardensis]
MKSVNIKIQDSKKPKYERIYAGFLTALKDGVLKPGERIPSTRDLAKIYKCHRLTVMNALQALVAEGWLEAKEKAHYQVSEKAPITESTKESPSKKKAPHFELASPAFSLTAERTRYKIEFWGGQPDLRLFPKDEFRKITSEALRRVKPDQLSYGATQGLPVLLEQVEEYFRRSRGLLEIEYLITNGSQEGIYIIAQTFLKPGDYVVVEGKGYTPAWRVLESLGAKLIPIAVDDEGLNTDELALILKKKKVKLIYTTPLHQYPTTVTLSPRRRQKLIQLAESYRIPILEDDYDHEFHYLSPPPAPLATQTPYAIYVASFSKILYPGARIGVLACHESLFEAFAMQKFLLSRQSDSLSQLSLAAWMKEGGFERHLRRTTRVYEKRFHYMQEQLELLKVTYGIDWVQPNGGMSYWVNLKTNSRKVSEAAKRKDVFFMNETELDFAKKDGTHLRIGFAGVNEAEIKQGFEVLNQILKKSN